MVDIKEFFLFVTDFMRTACRIFGLVFDWFTSPFTVLGVQFQYTPIELMFSVGLIFYLSCVIIKWVLDFVT